MTTDKNKENRILSITNNLYEFLQKEREKTRQETADEMEILLHKKIVELRVKLTKAQRVDSDIVDSELYNLDFWFGEELKKKFKEDKNG